MNASYAGLWARALAFALDYLIIAAYLVLVAAVGALVNLAFPELVQMLFGNRAAGQATGFALVTLPVVLYFALLESSAWQATWGKRRRGLRVVDARGGRLSMARALGRAALAFVPWELSHTLIWWIRFAPAASPALVTAGFALVWLLVGANIASLVLRPSHQTLYDWLAGTYVITVSVPAQGIQIMSDDQLALTYIGGPTALLEWGGLRLLTDPTFDPAGAEYPTGAYTLRKTSGPALSPESLGRIDAVLLSHDQHLDNLDYAGRVLLKRAGMVLTTPAGAERLGDHAVGLAPWQSIDLPAQDGRVLRVTGTPARHGPTGGDRGPVTGFVLAPAESPNSAVYISGDTVWYEGVAEVSQRFSIQIAILFMGAARIREVGPAHLTFTAAEAVEAARAFANATIIPLHYEAWEHLSESHPQIEAAFSLAGLTGRLQWMEPGVRRLLPQRTAHESRASTSSRSAEQEVL